MKWNTKLDYHITQTDKLEHILVSEGVAGVAKALGLNPWQSFLFSFLGFGVVKES